MASASPPPLRLAVIGVGHHCRTFHLPALRHYRRVHPGSITLAALVDPDRARAAAAAADFGFDAVYAGVDKLLATTRPDACLVVTPVTLNACTATALARAGLPVLMEKPPGATLVEARQLVNDLAPLDARVMVSMNRRFDPLLRAAREWIGSRLIRQVKTTMTRQARTEPDFIAHTGLHVVDAVLAIGGAVASCRSRRIADHGNVRFEAELAFTSGATGSIDLRPTAGTTAEAIEIAGDGWRVAVHSAEFDRGAWHAWSDGRLERDENLPPATPLFIANGTLAETAAFLGALQSGAPLFPTPADILPAMEICRRLEEARPEKLVSP